MTTSPQEPGSPQPTDPTTPNDPVEPDPKIDAGEPPRPDEIDTVSPGFTDESGRLPRDDISADDSENAGPAEVEVSQPSA